MALYFLKASGKFDAAVREWEQKAAAKKTWANIKMFIAFEYAKENKQNKLTAKKFRASNIKEHEAMEKPIPALSENHTHQMETLIKSTTNAMREMMSLIKNNHQAPNNQSNNQQAPNIQLNDEEKKKREERHKKYNIAPICKHCGKKHPAKPEDRCWELEKNNDNRPSN
jgi:hypothetical protein